MVELEHVAEDGAETLGIVRTPSGRFTLPSMLDRTLRTGTSIATTTASTINPISIATAIARSNVGADVVATRRHQGGVESGEASTEHQ